MRTYRATIASPGLDHPNRPIQNINSPKGKDLTARMITSSSLPDLYTGKDLAMSNLVSAFPTEILGQSTVTRNAGSFLLAAATILGGDSTPPQRILAQSDDFPDHCRLPLPPQILAQSDEFPDQRRCPLCPQISAQAQSDDAPDQGRCPPLSEITETSAKSVFITPIGNVPSKKMVPSLSTEFKARLTLACGRT